MNAMTIDEYTQAVWENRTNAEIFDACFHMPENAPDLGYHDLADVAGDLFERIVNTPDFTAGDLTHEQTVAAIVRRHPLLGGLQ